MKNQSCLAFLFLLFFSSLQAQETNLKNNEFGIDLSPFLISAMGGDPDADALEIIYREGIKNGALRFKFHVNNHNYFGADLVKGKSLQDNKPISFSSLEAIYTPKTSYLASLGLSTDLSNTQLPVYVGIDANLGVSRGKTTTYIKETFLTEVNRELIGNKDNNLTVVGVTPFLGIKKNLTDRLVFGLEFGLELNYVLGDLKYFDEQQMQRTASANRLDFSWKKLINDFTLLIRI